MGAITRGLYNGVAVGVVAAFALARQLRRHGRELRLGADLGMGFFQASTALCLVGAAVVQRLPDGSVGVFSAFLCKCRRRCAWHRRPRYAVAAAFA